MKLILIIFAFSVIVSGQVRLGMTEVFTDLKITYSEPVDSSAINPDNYELLRLATNANAGIAIFPISAEFENDSTIILHCSLQPPGVYRLDVSNVYDLNGNLVDPDYDSKTYEKER